MQILAVSGSLRRHSHNTGLLCAASAQAPDGIELVLWTGLKAIPPYDEDDDVAPTPAAVAALRQAVSGSDAVLFATPEYNGSVPGALKNALDWASRPFATNALRNKPVAVVGSSVSAYGAVWAQADLRKILGAIGARVTDVELAIGDANDRFDTHGNVIDESTRLQLVAVVDALAGAARAREATALAAA